MRLIKKAGNAASFLVNDLSDNSRLQFFIDDRLNQIKKFLPFLFEEVQSDIVQFKMVG
jgi:hypothetical protein